MGLTSENLNRRVQVQRATETPDGFGGVDLTWNDHGAAIFAQRRDVSDAERNRAAKWDNELVTRFTVRATIFARSIRRTDRLVHDGLTFEIDGIKEVPGTRAFLEITAVTLEAL